ncbi:UbiA family prenyltransferase [Streptomyces sp. JH14]|uniref:UbiA family prenyltransferase n=1 Tax=Streptomyces sp. JH14 TaxID=2793630 RepID=UPI0023F7A771|nr:UbiA family prenyltransferase [Streptomyces sp. JH14]MDF6040586.1 UbiA family prenyltransferase [Streptomyces sp. JH14]MDF6046197.1 UbiA family prenyltransferase [Streptomyces sp. JH14]
MTAAVRAWAELLRVSALFTVPGDALAGAAAIGRRPNGGTALAVGASLCLYEAGMALNDWADRDEDAVDRPHRPIPSGQITPGAALAAAGALTAAGLTLAAHAGRPALTVATGLAATVWAYDLRLKHTQAGPAAMAAARALDLLLGATATATATAGAGAGTGATSSRTAAPPAAGAVTPSATATGFVGASAPSRSVAGKRRGGPVARLLGRIGRAVATATADREPRRAEPPRHVQAPARPVGIARTEGPTGTPGAVRRAGTVHPGRTALPRGTTRTLSPVDSAVRAAVPAAALLGAHTYAVTAVSRHEAQGGSTAVPLGALAAVAALGAVTVRGQQGLGGLPRLPGRDGPGDHHRPRAGTSTPPGVLLTALTATYFRTAAEPLLHAALNPSAPLTQRAVGSGIRAMIPLQAALAARAGAAATGLAVMGLVPLARTLARKVSLT